MRFIKDNFQHFFLTFLAIIFVGLASYYVVHFGYYPIAIVNGSVIFSRSLTDEYFVAYRYYANLLGPQNEEVASLEFKKELRRAVLNDLIEKSLIRQELKTRVGKDLNSLVENKTKISAKGDDMEEAANLLYGLSLVDFREMVLVPKAQREILEGRLFLENKTIENWLAEAAENASVFILTPEFYWDKNRVALRD
jgi:hypothetical protein